jgi:hypothetical protein
MGLGMSELDDTAQVCEISAQRRHLPDTLYYCETSRHEALLQTKPKASLTPKNQPIEVLPRAARPAKILFVTPDLSHKV